MLHMAQGDVGADKTSPCPGAVAVTLQGREVTNGLSFPWTLTSAALSCWIQALARQRIES